MLGAQTSSTPEARSPQPLPLSAIRAPNGGTSDPVQLISVRYAFASSVDAIVANAFTAEVAPR